MKKILVLSAGLLLAACADDRLVNVYNAIDTNTTEESTVVDKKAAALKLKLNEKMATAADSTLAEKEELKTKLESKLAGLKADGEGSSAEALQIQREIESLQRLINAARQ